MLEVDKNDKRTIRVHRGDAGTLVFNIPINDTEYYKFQPGDKVQFMVFEEKGYDKEPVLSKEVEITEETEIVEITLNEQDTTLGEPLNKVAVYWYEVSLNEVQTVLGYDEEEQAAEYRILPARGGDKS